MTESKAPIVDFKSQKKFVDSLKSEWNLMWIERFNDKPKAEGVSMDNYLNVGVERGTIIHATRDFKALTSRIYLSSIKSSNQTVLFNRIQVWGAGENSLKKKSLAQHTIANILPILIVLRKRAIDHKTRRVVVGFT